MQQSSISEPLLSEIWVGKLDQRERIRLLSTGLAVAAELSRNYEELEALREDARALEMILGERRRIETSFRQPKDRVPAFLYSEPSTRLRKELRQNLESAFTSSATPDEFIESVSLLVVDSRKRQAAIVSAELQVGSIATFAGDAKKPPEYILWLMSEYGSIPTLHFSERKRKIGREEAEKLLALKTRRGGTQQLQSIQQTVKALLGVQIDAFRENDQSVAEMDVDQFLLEANGAGIREALRIVLDLELKTPKLVLIEEPEVHLHPGLSRVVANYLREKGQDIQLFVTTHSTEFVDSISFQNAYLVCRNSRGKTTCQLVEAEEEALRIPAELGLRLSTVFMFDRLLFVEGPTDEAVLRAIARGMDVDLATKNIGFVHMGGIRNFAYYAAQSTLDLLSRRQLKMWFIADRDEMDNIEVTAMMQRLGPSAELCVLKRREIENYLLDAPAITSFLLEKQKTTKPVADAPTIVSVKLALENASEDLKQDVIRRRTEKRLLSPVYLRGAKIKGTVQERIEGAKKQLEERAKEGLEIEGLITEEVGLTWQSERLNIVSGASLLDEVAKSFGFRFSKEKGDSEALARLINENAVPAEMKDLIRKITADDVPLAVGRSGL